MLVLVLSYKLDTNCFTDMCYIDKYFKSDIKGSATCLMKTNLFIPISQK